MRLIDADALIAKWEEEVKHIEALDHRGMVYGAINDVKRQQTIEVPRWIPVTEKTLPNHNSVVVVCGEKGTWDFGTYRGHTPNHINFWNWKKNTVKEVHWWMYKEDALPKPWEGGENG